MLVLSRFKGEKILIGDNIVITVADIDRGKVRIGVEAPDHVSIHRKELRERIENESIVQVGEVS